MGLVRHKDRTGAIRCRLTSCPFCGYKFVYGKGNDKVNHLRHECEEAPREVTDEQLEQIMHVSPATDKSEPETR